jgi:hypothetical protein
MRTWAHLIVSSLGRGSVVQTFKILTDSRILIGDSIILINTPYH